MLLTATGARSPRDRRCRGARPPTSASTAYGASDLRGSGIPWASGCFGCVMRTVDDRWIRFLMASHGLLTFRVDALLRAVSWLGGPAVSRRGARVPGGDRAPGVAGWTLAAQPPSERRVGLSRRFLVALASAFTTSARSCARSAYAVGYWPGAAPGSVCPHNTTEGGHRRPGRSRGQGPLRRLAGLGCWPSRPPYWARDGPRLSPGLAGLLFGIGAGAIAQVIVQSLPRFAIGRARSPAQPLVAGGLLSGARDVRTG